MSIHCEFVAAFPTSQLIKNALSAQGLSNTSGSDVCKRQILTNKDDPHTERAGIFTMAVDP